MKYLATILILASTLNLSARMTETYDECVKRYGPPVKLHKRIQEAYDKFAEKLIDPKLTVSRQFKKGSAELLICFDKKSKKVLVINYKFKRALSNQGYISLLEKSTGYESYLWQKNSDHIVIGPYYATTVLKEFLVINQELVDKIKNESNETEGF